MLRLIRSDSEFAPMQLTDVGTIIATREFQTDQGKITVLIGLPQKFPEEEDYFCPYQIVGTGSGRVRRAGGVDAVQALQGALRMIGTDIYTSAEAQQGQLSWVGGRGLHEIGFPLPE